MERDFNKISETGPFCPVTGLRIYQKPEWRDIPIGKDYSLTLTVIEKNILLAQSRGYSTRKDVEKAMTFVKQVLSETLAEGESYIHVSDYSKLKGASLTARKYYIDYLKKQDRIACLIFFGTMPLVNMSIKLVKRITRNNYDIEVVDEYQDAMEIAVGRLKEIRNLSTEQTLHRIYQKQDLFLKANPKNRLSEGRIWNLQMEGFSIHSRSLMRMSSIQSLKAFFERHVEPLHQLRRKAMTQSTLQMQLTLSLPM